MRLGAVAAAVVLVLGGGAGAGPREGEPLAGRVRGFLSAWLVARDVDAALGYFAREAFENEVLLAESCTGRPERMSAAERKRRVRRFLEEFARDAPGGRLSEILRPEVLTRAAGGQKLHPLNRVRDDGFVVFRVSAGEATGLAESNKGQQYLKGRLKGERVAVALVPIGDGVLYSIWLGEEEKAEIYHVGMFCM
jgi:hypothetical protein